MTLTPIPVSPTLHLMVGLPCSGKTTLARQLERERLALRLTPDEWQIPLFVQDVNHPEHDNRHNQVESLLWELAQRALSIGTSIILDFGFWSREEREFFRGEAKKLGAASEVHFLDVDETELLRRLSARNAQDSSATFVIPQEMMKAWIAQFQKPDANEQLPRKA